MAESSTPTMNHLETATMVFLHGAGGTRSKWRKIEGLSTTFSSVFVDLPGHGVNQSNPQDDIERYAEVLAQYIQGSAILVGHSMGGLVGIEMAARMPTVKGLVLMASHFCLPVHPKILASLDAAVFPESLFLASYSKNVDLELLQDERAELELTSMSVAAVDYHACNRYNGRTAISSLEIPILAVYGQEDRLLPKNAAEALMELNANVQTISVSDSGHYIMLEQPQRTVEILEEFFTGVHSVS